MGQIARYPKGFSSGHYTMGALQAGLVASPTRRQPSGAFSVSDERDARVDH